MRGQHVACLRWRPPWTAVVIRSGMPGFVSDRSIAFIVCADYHLSGHIGLADGRC